MIQPHYNQEKKSLPNFALPADHAVKSKESEKKDKYLDITRELKKLWNMKVTVMPIVMVPLVQTQNVW